jgi:hypothetical protein
VAFDWSGPRSRTEVRNFLERSQKVFDEYSDLDGEVPKAAYSFQRASGQAQEQAARYLEPFRLAVVGEFNAGKSALINALLGRRGFLLEGITPTTGAITELWWGSQDQGEVTDEAGNAVFIGDLQTAVKYTDQRTAEGRSIAGRGARIVLRTNAPLLRNLVIIDTPGLGASVRDDAVTRGVLHVADAALMVVSALQPGGEDTVELAEWMRVNRRRVVLAVTRLDQTDDAENAYTAAKDLLDGVVDGAPIGVVAPKILDALAELEAGERSREEAEITSARAKLTEFGYVELTERVQDDFVHGNAAMARAVTCLTTVSAAAGELLRMVSAGTAQSERAVEQAQEGVGEVRKHLHSILPPKARYLDERIDEAVDLHVSDFIARLGEAVDVFIDRVAGGGLQASIRAIRTITATGKARASAQLRADFEDFFPSRQMEISINSLTRSVSSLLEAEWGATARDLSPDLTGKGFDAAAVTRGIVEQIGEMAALTLTTIGAYVLALCNPGGVLFDLTALVLSGARFRPPGSKANAKVALQKRDARVRLRNQRSDLVDLLGGHYREVNAGVRDKLIAKATADATAKERAHDEAQAELRRWSEAGDDLERLVGDAQGLAGELQ